MIVESEARNIIVTGGTRGIGREIVMYAAEHGYGVAFTYNNAQQQAIQLCEELNENNKDVIVRCYQLDLGNLATIEPTTESIIADFGSIYGVINNAAILRNNPAALMSDEDWLQVLTTNLSGPFYLIRSLLLHFLSNKKGRVISILSLALDGASGQCNYSASKAGLLGLTNSIGKEYGRKNITANSIIAGLVATDMMKEHLADGLKGIWEQFSPIPQLPQTGDIASAVLYLLSDGAKQVNCEVLNVTGGMRYVP